MPQSGVLPVPRGACSHDHEALTVCADGQGFVIKKTPPVLTMTTRIHHQSPVSEYNKLDKEDARRL
jgi:hypothetical protein